MLSQSGSCSCTELYKLDIVFLQLVEEKKEEVVEAGVETDLLRQLLEALV